MAFQISSRPQYEDCFCGKISTPAPNRTLVKDDGAAHMCVGPKRRVGKGQYGGQILLCGKKDSYFPFHCMVGPDWPVVVIVYVLVIVIDAIVLPIISPLGWPVLLIGLFGFAVTLISYSAVACSDPGIIYDTETRNVNSDSPRNSHDLESGPLVQNQEMQTQELLGSGAPHSAVYAVTPSVAFNARTESGESLRVLKNDEPADRNNQSSSVPATTNEASSTVNHSVVSASSPQLQIPLQVNGVSTSNVMQCGQCEIIRPKTARHCNYCGVCVDHLDHHCPCKYTIGLVSCTSVYHIFVCESIGCGKCIGKKNIKAFHVFVSAVCFQMYFLGGALIYYIVSVFAKWPHGPKA
jgi:hypothetical protein